MLFVVCFHIGRGWKPCWYGSIGWSRHKFPQRQHRLDRWPCTLTAGELCFLLICMYVHYAKHHIWGETGLRNMFFRKWCTFIYVSWFSILWVWYVAHMEEGRGVHRVLVRKPEGRRPLGRPRCRWEDNIKMDLQEGGGFWGLDGVGSW